MASMIEWMIRRREELRTHPQSAGRAIGVSSSPYQREITMADVYRIEGLSRRQHLPAWHISKQTGIPTDRINAILEE